uniref:F-box domain-containing protein n=1 Tax=Rhipicephalus zambeziensis TaxID=60191 RepID=A0A224YJ95_9ACAR
MATRRAGLSHFITEAGILRALVRTVFNHLPPESGLGRVRKVCRTIRRLLSRSRRSPNEPLAAQAVADCELAAAYILQRMQRGHQIETLLLLLASIARVRSLCQRLAKERSSKPEDESKLKRLYRRLLKNGCEKPVLLKRTCLRALRSVRAGRSSVAEEARKMRAVCGV